MKIWNQTGEKQSISEGLFLTIPDHAVISLTGAGGKTSLLFAWARELADQGRRVVITTTTHMGAAQVPPEIPCVIGEGKEEEEQVRHFLSERGIVFAAVPDPANAAKVKSPSPEYLDALDTAADVMLVEADGARCMPFKWPAPWEPVILPRTNITVAVAGLSCLGKPAGSCTYRSEDMVQALKLSRSEETILSEEILAEVLASPEGAGKSRQGEFRVLLNQADTRSLRQASGRIAESLRKKGILCSWGCHPSAAYRREKMALILLAAGNSRRFGSNKLLYPLGDGVPVIGHLLKELQDFPFGQRILVTRYPEVAALAEGYQICCNHEPERGLSHSLQLGLEAAGEASAYLFCVCDMPWLRRESIEEMLKKYESGAAGIISLSWQGEPRQPNLFSSEYREELMQIKGDRGGKKIILDHPEDCCMVEASSGQEVEDMDYPPI